MTQVTNGTGQIDWNSIITKVVGFLLVGAIVMLIETRLEVEKLKDFERYKKLFWNVNGQDKKWINKLILEHNAEHPDHKMELYLEYDKTGWPE